MSALRTLLLIEDSPGDARLLCEMFNEQGSAGTKVTHLSSMQEAEAHLAAHAVDIILLDLGLPDSQGLDAVRRAHAAAVRVPLVVLTGFDDESLARQALQEGAEDYLIKGQIEARSLMRALRYAIERKAMEEALLAEKERAQATLHCIGDAVACTDSSGALTFINRVAEEMTGWSWREAAGKAISDVFNVADGTTREPIALQMGGAQTRTQRLPANCVLVRRDGTATPVEDSVAPILDREGRSTGAVIVLRDVSAARAMSQQILHAAQHDFLTGLPNRVHLSNRIGHAIALAARHQRKLAVLFLDLDGFKHVNDSLGHPIGDKLLQSVGARLVHCLRGVDSVSRQGGDEFVVLLSEIAMAEDAAIVVRRLLKAVALAHVIGEHELHISASIGISVYPADGTDPETLIKNADTAMYQAKENGRHRYQFFMPAMNVRAVERQSIEEGLRRALEHEELTLHYQPKIDLRTGDITGAEALVRWTHPTRGVVSPAQFIPVAEASGLIVSLGKYVLREACRQAQAWRQLGLPAIGMAVNVSAMELRGEGFIEDVFAVLGETGLDPSSLELELTESVLMKHAESAQAMLKVLRSRGVRVAIDDFGTGYSSLSYLRKFSIDTLKIDQSFVRQITTHPDDKAIVDVVIGLGQSLKLRVVAEGVETAEELGFLQAHGCDEAQGYYFSRPVVPEEFARLLAIGHVRMVAAWVSALASRPRLAFA